LRQEHIQDIKKA